MAEQSKQEIEKLLSLMATLRHPAKGCSWDLAQTFKTIAPFTIEEAYEVAEAIELDDMQQLKAELGDLLFQVVFHAQMADEKGVFNFSDVVSGITDKLTKRHPHVFEAGFIADKDLNKQWEAIKRAETTKRQPNQSLLDGVGLKLPALTTALKLQKKASGVGFDWDSLQAVLDKLEEEIDELKIELLQNNKQAMIDELGDVMFCCVNMARHLEVDPEWTLREANAKFKRRFDYIEAQLKLKGIDLASASSELMEGLWLDAKKLELENITSS